MTDFSVDIPGFSIACRTWGSSNNPPLIALHGWLDNANSFVPIAPELADSFFVIALDLPGHGLSAHLPEGCHYHFVDGIYTLLAVIEALGYQSVNMLGHSMGACLASLIAGVSPETINNLYLIEGLGPFSAPAESAQNQLSRYSHHQSGIQSKQVTSYKSIEQAAAARAKRGHVSIEIAKILCERGVSMRDGEYVWCHDRRLLSPTALYLTEEQILSCLAQISAPTRLIMAKQGFEFDKNLMEKRIKTVDNIKVERLDGGHHVHMENPKAVAQLIK